MVPEKLWSKKKNAKNKIFDCNDSSDNINPANDDTSISNTTC
jgi:hypothetical protein